jgi:hypothetical protein
MARISEDIRFYLPSDPYYYKVDNLPLQDLLKNDRRLQTQIDELQQADVGVTVNRNGMLELKPFINNAIPGTISVNPGNFIGRVQRSSNGNGVPGSTLESVYNGTEGMGSPPTMQDPEGGTGDWKYNTGNPPNNQPEAGEPRSAGYSVGRTAVFNFPGGNISIDGFNTGDFQSVQVDDVTLAPQGRIDVVGITTVNGAQDDPFIPGNAEELNVAIGNGQCKLAVVKGAGLVTGNENREVGITIGERYQTIGQPQDEMNLTGKNPDGTLSNDPRIGTYPMPDDVVNICFSRSDIRNNLTDWAQRNRNASFFLPIAYVFVNDTYSLNNPIPQNWLYDIRPFFRTAELTLNERQSLAASVNPSVTNPVITASYQETRFTEEVNRTAGVVNLQAQIDDLKSQLETAFSNINGSRIVTTEAKAVTSNLSTSYVSYYPVQDFGIPDTATHVIVWGKISGDLDNSTPELMVDGGDGEYILVAARGQDEAGRDDTDSGMAILALNSPGTNTSNFRARRTTSGGNEQGTLQIRGYIEPVNNSITFTTPQE